VLTHPNKLFLERGASSLRTTPELAGDPQLDLLADPDSLFALPQCQIIKDQRKIKVGRLQLEIGGKVVGVYLKRYNAFSWRYRLGSLFIPSGASRSWEGASILLSAGFRTGRPIAAVECRSWCMLDKSFYLSEEIPGGKTADDYWLGELASIQGPEGFFRRRNFLRGLARLFGSLHERRIYHNDLKDANILVSSGGGPGSESFFLLDLEGIRKYRCLSRRRQVKNLIQLNRTMGRFLKGTEKLCWLREYLGNRFFDRKEKREWIRKILERSVRGDRRSLRKRSIALD
jgi:serine/threonine protein kinase